MASQLVVIRDDGVQPTFWRLARRYGRRVWIGSDQERYALLALPRRVRQSLVLGENGACWLRQLELPCGCALQVGVDGGFVVLPAAGRRCHG